MTIENRLTELRALEVGKVEKAIEGIEKSKLDREAASQEIREELESYKRMLEEKLPTIIGNIVTMGRFVVELGNAHGSNTFIHQEGKIYTLSREISRPAYDHLGGGFRMLFDNSGNIQQINLEELTSFGRRHWYSLRKDILPIPLIQAETQDNFITNYIDLVVRDLKRCGDSRYVLLPPILNNVPEEIMLMYEQRKREVEGRLSAVKKRNGELGSLEVSDLI